MSKQTQLPSNYSCPQLYPISLPQNWSLVPRRLSTAAQQSLSLPHNRSLAPVMFS